MCLSVTSARVSLSLVPYHRLPSFDAGPLGILVGKKGSETESGEVGLAGGGFRGVGWVLLGGAMLWTLQFPLQVSESSVSAPSFLVPQCCVSGLAFSQEPSHPVPQPPAEHLPLGIPDVPSLFPPSLL